MPSKYAQRFQELTIQLEAIAASKKPERNAFTSAVDIEINSNELLNWQVKVESLLANACGTDSNHLSAFCKAAEHAAYNTNFMRFERMGAVFLAAKEDFDGGYLSSVKTLIQAKVFSTELEQASSC
jgi:hypothetical protein